MEKCKICGKKLTREASILRGTGDICENESKTFIKGNKDCKANFDYKIIKINNEDVAVIVDNDTDGYRSVTNSIDVISEKLGVKKIIYRDSLEVWDFWSDEQGFGTLFYKGNPTTNYFLALQVAEKRYFNNGLFK